MALDLATATGHVCIVRGHCRRAVGRDSDGATAGTSAYLANDKRACSHHVSRLQQLAMRWNDHRVSHANDGTDYSQLVNRVDLRTRILEALNESASSPVFWSASEINDLIDEGMEVVCEESQAIKRTVFIPLRPGTAYYSLRGLGPNIMAPWRVWLHSQDRRLEAVSMADLDRRHETWSTVTGDPWYWFPVSWDLFGIWPSPSSGGGVLRVNCLAWPNGLQDDDEEPELLASDHDALTLYAVTEGAAKRWDVATALSAWAMFLRAAGASTERSGVGRAQARVFHRAEADV